MLSSGRVSGGPSPRRLVVDRLGWARTQIWALFGLCLALLASTGSSSSSSVPDDSSAELRSYCLPQTNTSTGSTPTDNIACHCPKTICQCFYVDYPPGHPNRIHGATPFNTHCRGLTTVPANIYHLSTTIILEGQITSLDDGGALQTQSYLTSYIFNANNNLITELRNTTLRQLLTVEFMLLADNRISTIQAGAFTGFRLLKQIDLSRNRLHWLPDDVFVDCLQLQHLFLDGNRLSEVPWNTLPNVSDIRSLRLWNNTIAVVQQSDFMRTPRLNGLDLSNNGLTRLVSDLGEFPTSRLTNLNLAGNRILIIPEVMLWGLHNLQFLGLSDNPLLELKQENFAGLYSLQELDLSGTKISQERIAPYVFRHLASLIHLDLDYTDSLTYIMGSLLWYSGNVLRGLHIQGTRFRALPAIGDSATRKCHLTEIYAGHGNLATLNWAKNSELCTLCSGLEHLYFESSQLYRIDPLQACTNLTIFYAVGAKFTADSIEGIFENHTSLESINLARNPITRISDKVFGHMPSLRELNLSDIYQLTEIDDQAFAQLTGLRHLYLARTGITTLPLKSTNAQLIVLDMSGTFTMRFLPDVSAITNLQVAHMAYQFHCCAFRIAAEDKKELAGPVTTPPVTNSTVLFDPVTAATGYHVQTGHVSTFTYEEWLRYNKIWNSPNVQVHIVNHYPDRIKFKCSPEPDALTPCREMFSEVWLRVAAWCVSILALGGNITVILVIIFGKHKLDNTRFLVLNLAFADLLLGIYLLILCIVDISTKGRFGLLALDWQNSYQAQAAGFLAVFSTEMSFYTLTLITIERYITIKLSMDMRYRLTRRRLYGLALIGWLVSFVLALLPMFGMSSYSTNILALPFEISSVSDKAFVSFLLLFNGLCITIITFCYAVIYWAVRSSPAYNKKDNTIARRMALLVFADLACWLPLAILGLSFTFAGRLLISFEAAKVIAVFIFPLNSCANPFLYAIVTNNFQRDLIRILKSFPEKVGDLSRRRSSLKTTPQPSDSKSTLHGMAQYVARAARLNLNGTEGSHSSYNQNSSMPPSISRGHSNGSVGGDGLPFDARLAAASQLDSESSSEGMPGSSEICVNCERRDTIVSCQPSELTDITECGAASEMGDTQSPTPTSADKRDLDCAHRVPPPVVAASSGVAPLPDISEQSDPSSSQSDGGRHGIPRAAAPPDGGSRSPPSRVVGGLLMGALSAFTPILAGHTRSSQAGSKQQAASPSSDQQEARDGSAQTQTTLIDKTEDQEKQKSCNLTPASCYSPGKRAAQSASSSYQQQSSPGHNTSDETPICACHMETSL